MELRTGIKTFLEDIMLRLELFIEQVNKHLASIVTTVDVRYILS